jgi:hypothetical protein
MYITAKPGYFLEDNGGRKRTKSTNKRFLRLVTVRNISRANIELKGNLLQAENMVQDAKEY